MRLLKVPLPQKDAIKHFLKFFNYCLFTVASVTLSKAWRKVFPTSSKPANFTLFCLASTDLCLFFSSLKIDTAVLFDNNAHFYFLVHRKPYYTKTSLINSLTDSYRMGYMNQKMSFVYLSTTAQKSQKREHTTLLLWSHKNLLTFPNVFILNYF